MHNSQFISLGVLYCFPDTGVISATSSSFTDLREWEDDYMNGMHGHG